LKNLLARICIRWAIIFLTVIMITAPTNAIAADKCKKSFSYYHNELQGILAVFPKGATRAANKIAKPAKSKLKKIYKEELKNLNKKGKYRTEDAKEAIKRMDKIVEQALSDYREAIFTWFNESLKADIDSSYSDIRKELKSGVCKKVQKKK